MIRLPIAAGTIFLLAFSPLFYGGVSFSALYIIQALSLILMATVLFQSMAKNTAIEIPGLPFIAVSLFIVSVLFQLILMPKDLVFYLSKGSYNVWIDYGAEALARYSLTICRERTLNTLVQLLSYISMFIVIVHHADSYERQSRLVKFIIICGVIYSLSGIATRLSGFSSSFSTFANRDHFSAYIEMIIPLALAYSFIQKSPVRRVVWIFVTSVMLIALFVAGSRAARILSPSGLMIFSFLLMSRHKKRSLAISLTVFIIFVAIFFVIIGLSTMTNRMDTLLIPSKAFHGRMEVFKDSLAIIRDFPLFGTGFGTFGEIFQKYKTVESSSFYRFAHNEPLQLLIETGIAGFLGLSLFFLLLFYDIIKQWMKRNDPFPIAIVLGCLTGLSTVLVHSLVEFVFQVPAISLLFFVLLALAYKTVYTRMNADISPLRRVRAEMPRYARLGIAIIIGAIVVWLECVIYQKYAAEAIMQSIEKESPVTGKLYGYSDILKKIDRAILLDGLNSRYWSKKGDILVDMAVSREAKNIESIAVSNDAIMSILSSARECYKKAIELNPANAEYHFRLGWLYRAKGESGLAGMEFKKALSLDPMNKKMSDQINKYNSI